MALQLLPFALAAGKALVDHLSKRNKEKAAYQDYIDSPSNQLRNSLIRALVMQYNLGQAFGQPDIAQRLTTPPRFRGSSSGFDLFNSLLNSTQYIKRTPGGGSGGYG